MGPNLIARAFREPRGSLFPVEPASWHPNHQICQYSKQSCRLCPASRPSRPTSRSPGPGHQSSRSWHAVPNLRPAPTRRFATGKKTHGLRAGPLPRRGYSEPRLETARSRPTKPATYPGSYSDSLIVAE